MRRQTRISQTTPEFDRRRHNRFDVVNGVFASLSPQFAIIGQILNVSEGGLAFRYVASKPRSTEAVRLDILVADGSLSVDKLEFRSVWDISTPQEFVYGPITYRHCGVEWTQLNLTQRAELVLFIKCYTDNPVPNDPPPVSSLMH